MSLERRRCIVMNTRYNHVLKFEPGLKGEEYGLMDDVKSALNGKGISEKASEESATERNK